MVKCSILGWKKYILDDFDGFPYSWYDLRREKQINIICNFGSGSLIVFAAFLMHEKAPLAKISTRNKSRDYIAMLNGILILFIADYMDINLIFQQNNATIQVNRDSKT